ncbi:PPOX class F420-dependent oxidoreductase [Ornithinimicrobium sp. W1665]|uniref:PPOX class F420-dependent oxidoreductase n=1 Tax=Ornithinimicrobium sp. W1665 TaxID=3416666 RepID=UPI003CFB0C38
MARTVATTTTVDREGLLEFVRPRHDLVLITIRQDGRPQASPVTGGVDERGRIVISTYPERAKTHNARRDPRVSVVVLSDDFGGAWVQVDGDCEVLDCPESVEPLVDYFRAVAGEHPNWEEYRRAMIAQGKSLLRITPTRWSPVATGGFPARLVED